MKLDSSLFRDRWHHAAAVATEAMAPVLRIVARTTSRGAATPPAEWRSGVILGSGHIGDVLFRTCSLDLLRRGLPRCDWSYLTTPTGTAVLAGNPALKELLPWTTDSGSEPLMRDHIHELRERAFDVALCTENVSHHRALWRAVRLGVPNRVAFIHKGFSGLATYGVTLTERMPHPAPFRRMVEQITGLHDGSPFRPRIFPSDEDIRAANGEWASLGLDDAEFVVACSVTTRQMVSACPPELFIAILGAALELAPQARIILAGTTGDRPLLESVARQLGPRASISAASLSALQYGALLRRCAVFLGTDSGPRHLANAGGIPVFFVRSLRAGRIETGPYCATETDIAPPGEYLAPAEVARALGAIDSTAVATSIVAAARRRLRDTASDTQH